MIVVFITLVHLPLFFIMYYIGKQNGARQYEASVRAIMNAAKEMVVLQSKGQG